MGGYGSVWRKRLTLVAIKLTRSRHVSAQDGEQVDIESGTYGQEKLGNNELCRSSGLARSS